MTALDSLSPIFGGEGRVRGFHSLSRVRERVRVRGFHSLSRVRERVRVRVSSART
jgi:hypothetical protein